MDRFPRIWAHRGARIEAPENTLPAFRRAFELGADGIELDIMACADGRLVVTHDEEVSRLSDGKGFVAEMTFETVKTLDFGIRFGPEFAGVRAPGLDEVLDELPAGGHVNIEIKNNKLASRGEEAKVAALVRKHDLHGRVIVSSFNPFALRRLRKIDPDIPVGWLFEAASPLYLRPKPVGTMLRPDAMHPEFTALTEEDVRVAHQRGRHVNVWTVNQPIDMLRMIDWGVDGIITDYPDRLVRIRSDWNRIKRN